ncbi:hypothetical protein GCM10009641_06800 [Mycobacterium cookii]|uniref:Uncharacterized protein n=1 Tax=Mycobacterium cookii TaxID=1775 RepID=A0A7I7L1Q9_9MYCO|nr:hypothetical protein [Mycobacterium cookii]MCV7333014.1 hypothetical protein [Mycobacterium cookii]BBX48275.1 hypothetical protein MCOO_42900 [Mycobacterium cookii]
MQKDATTGAGQTDRSIGERLWDRRAELLWGLAAAVLLLTFVDPVLLVSLVLAGATIAAAWLGIRELVQSATRDDAKQVASPLPRPAPAGRPEQTSAHPQWHGHHAA